MRPVTPAVAAFRNAVSHNHSPLAKPLPQARQGFGWGPVLGHHHRRFTSASIAHHNALKSSLQLSSKTWITVGTITATLFGPLFWRNFKNVAHCAESPAPETAAKKSEPKKIPSSTPPGTSGQNEKGSLINTKEISFGGAMGLCSGYLFKKLGKMFLLVAGLGFVSLQLLANTGYIQVNWVKIESQFKDKFDLDGDGQVTVKDARFGLQWIIDLLTKNFQFKSTFAGGFMLGFRYG